MLGRFPGQSGQLGWAVVLGRFQGQSWRLGSGAWQVPGSEWEAELGSCLKRFQGQQHCMNGWAGQWCLVGSRW